MVLEDTGGKRAAQKELERSVKARLKSKGVRNIGFQSGNSDETIFSNGSGSLWCAFGSAEDAKIPRRWNAFGVFDDKRHAQIITVEVNIPTTTNSGTVAGFFARDPSTGIVYLMHDGGIGGGKPGVGQSAFLAWSDHELIDVGRANGDVREGILVGRVDSTDIAARIWRYVQSVRDFKDAIASGALDTDALRRRVAEWDAYRKEARGRRRGTRRAEIDYISYHGDVVDLLREECEARKSASEQVLNSPLIDLYVRSGGTMTELFEVKTSISRQSLYTAIGQLVTHSADGGASVSKTLVIPEGDLPDDLVRSIAALNIDVRRFRLSRGAKPKISLL
jgi:hypothetical protein